MKVAIIGVGSWGQKLTRVFFELDVLYAVCDVNIENLESTHKLYPNIKVTPFIADILDDPEINAVVIAVPSIGHFRLAKQCLLSGKDVFVEKPMTLSLEDGFELEKISEQENKILMVGHLLEYHPAILKLKEFIENGELGKVCYMYSSRLNLGKIRCEENILWSFAPHDISVMLLLLNELPTQVSVHGGNYLHHDIADVTVSNLEFSNGVKGHIFVSWLHPYKEQKLIVVGDKKMAVFDDTSEHEKLLLYHHNIEWKNRIPVSRKENALVVEISQSEPLKEECKHFIECVRNRQHPKTDGHNGIRVLKVLQACEKSLKSNGKSVELNYSTSSLQHFYAHPTAMIEDSESIGEGTKIWHYSHIMKGAKIGKNCQLGKNVFVATNVEIGNGVKIQNNVSVYEGVKLEDDVFCGPSMVFTNVINPRSHVSRKHEFKKTHVKKGVTIGANATIVCGITMGEYAFVGAGSVVTKDVLPYALVYGNPAIQHGWMCPCGIKLQAQSQNDFCNYCGNPIAEFLKMNRLENLKDE